jgi:hypothetical protein
MMGRETSGRLLVLKKVNVIFSLFRWKQDVDIGPGKFGKHSGCNAKTAFDTLT